MIIDSYNRYSSDQAITASGATVSTNVVDLGAAGDAIGRERYLHILVKEAVTTEAATTVTFGLYTDSAVGMGSQVLKFETDAIAVATLVAGYQVAKVRLPAGMDRYTRGTYTTDDTLSTGQFDMWLGDAGDANNFTA